MTTICISAGHNPAHPGACFEGFSEHPEAALWAKRIFELLPHTVSPHLVPTGTLRSKVQYINDADATLAVEIHFNSAKNADGEHVGRGSETLYYPGSADGKDAATSMQKHLAPVFSPDRGASFGVNATNSMKGR